MGVRAVEGTFHAGDVVAILDPDGTEIARGLVNYADTDLRLIAGAHTAQIEDLLGVHPYDEAVHRDNLSLV